MKDLTIVEFHGTSLVAIKGATPAETLIAMKPVVEGMSLAWQSQHRKIMDHPVLSTCVTVMAMQMPGDGQRREWVFMPLNRINFWLATLQPNRIENAAIRANVIRYQIECADALFDHFFGQSERADVIQGQPELRDTDNVKVRMVTEARQTFGPRASGQLWHALGLPMVPAMYAEPTQRNLFDHDRLQTLDDAA